MIEPWILAVGALIVGLLSGVVGAALVRRIISSRRADNVELVEAGRAAGLFVFAFMTTVGLVVALVSTEPGALDDVPAALLSYAPQIFAAGIIVTFGRAAAIALSGLAGRAFADGPARSRAQASGIVRHTVTAATLVLAMSQLRLDTSILVVFMGAVLFAAAGTFVLLVGLGGRSIAAELAAGRYLHRLMRAGDHVVIGDITGQIVTLHAASVEIVTAGGDRVHVPNSTAFSLAPRIISSPSTSPPAARSTAPPAAAADASGESGWVSRAAHRSEASDPISEKST